MHGTNSHKNKKKLVTFVGNVDFAPPIIGTLSMYKYLIVFRRTLQGTFV